MCGCDYCECGCHDCDCHGRAREHGAVPLPGTSLHILTRTELPKDVEQILLPSLLVVPSILIHLEKYYMNYNQFLTFFVLSKFFYDTCLAGGHMPKSEISL